MINLYPEQLYRKLKKQSSYCCYILFGNNEFLLYDTQNHILKCIQLIHCCETFNFSIEHQSIWEKIFETYKKRNLFNHKKKFLSLSNQRKKLISIS